MAERRAETPLIDLPLTQAVVRLAVPATGAMVLRWSNHLVDQYWVGKLPNAEAALAAIGASSFLIWIFYTLSALFQTGLRALVSRAVGAQDPRAQARAVRHGLLLACALGVVAAGLGLLVAEPISRLTTASPEAHAYGMQYMRIVFLGLPISYIAIALGTIFRAEGDTVTPFRIGLLTVVVNFFLDPALINGLGPFPALGVAGSALATVAVQVIELAMLAWLYRRRGTDAQAGFEVRELVRFLRLGTPVTIMGVAWCSVYLILAHILRDFGDAAVAALTLGHMIEGLPFFFAIGFAAAASTLVGQNLGAGRPEDAERAGWRVTGILLIFLVPLSVLMYLFAEPILVFFAPEAREAVALGTVYLRFAAGVMVLTGVCEVLWQCITTGGEVIAPTVWDLSIDVLRVALAYLLAHTFGMGPIGVYLAMAATIALASAGWIYLFHRGRWKHALAEG